MGRHAQGSWRMVSPTQGTLNSLQPGALDFAQFYQTHAFLFHCRSFARWNSIYARHSVPTVAKWNEFRVIIICLRKVVIKWKSACILFFYENTKRIEILVTRLNTHLNNILCYLVSCWHHWWCLWHFIPLFCFFV